MNNFTIRGNFGHKVFKGDHNFFRLDIVEGDFIGESIDRKVLEENRLSFTTAMDRKSFNTKEDAISSLTTMITVLLNAYYDEISLRKV